jgi:hypothetical protein
MPNKAAKAIQYALPPAIVGAMGSQDPVDYATMYGSFRGAVPLSLLFHSGSLNEGEDEFLRKIMGPDGFYVRRPGTDLQPKMQNPGPNALSQAMNRMELYSQNPNFDSLTPEQKARVIKNYVDLKAMNSESRQGYQKGGEVKKVVKEEMIDPARRAFFGLRAKPATEQLPAVLQPPVAPMPSVSDLLGAAASVPISRRSVMQSALGQAIRGALPDLGALGSVGNAVKAMESVPKAVSKAVPVMPQTLQGLIAHFAKKGLSEDDTIKMLEKMGEANEDDVMYMLNPMRNPYEFVADFGEDAMSPTRALSNLINTGTDKPPMTMRGPLREIKRENPEMYDDLIRAARDISEYGFE